jgi:hypothetical protein
LKHNSITQALSKRAKKFRSQLSLNRIPTINNGSHSNSSSISTCPFLRSLIKMHKYPKIIKELSQTSSSLSSLSIKCTDSSNTRNNKLQINSINNNSSRPLRAIINLKASSLEGSKFQQEWLLPYLPPCIPQFSSNSTNSLNSNLLTLKWLNLIRTESNFSESCLIKNTKRF